MKRLLCFLLLPWCMPTSSAGTRPSPIAPGGVTRGILWRGMERADYLRTILYESADSALVVRLLGAKPEGDSDVLFYARQFLGKPYVAHTLEIADPEQLIVNLRGLDCTTLVETACALAMTHRQESNDFADFCWNLEQLRYRNGQLQGYLSRLHYFAWWMQDNVRRGNVREVNDATHWTSSMTVRNHYMTRHWEQYRLLKRHPEWVAEITRMEQAGNGGQGFYLPQSALRLGRTALSAIQDGDIIAIVTTKDGLDYSHLGFAMWGEDGHLHMLHASSLYKRVVEDPKTLHQYLNGQRTSVGIRLLRLQ